MQLTPLKPKLNRAGCRCNPWHLHGYLSLIVFLSQKTISCSYSLTLILFPPSLSPVYALLTAQLQSGLFIMLEPLFTGPETTQPTLPVRKRPRQSRKPGPAPGKSLPNTTIPPLGDLFFLTYKSSEVRVCLFRCGGQTSPGVSQVHQELCYAREEQEASE